MSEEAKLQLGLDLDVGASRSPLPVWKPGKQR